MKGNERYEIKRRKRENDEQSFERRMQRHRHCAYGIFPVTAANKSQASKNILVNACLVYDIKGSRFPSTVVSRSGLHYGDIRIRLVWWDRRIGTEDGTGKRNRRRLTYVGNYRIPGTSGSAARQRNSGPFPQAKTVPSYEGVKRTGKLLIRNSSRDDAGVAPIAVSEILARRKWTGD